MTAKEFHAINSAVLEEYRDNMSGKTLCSLDYTPTGYDGFFEDMEKYHELEDREVVGIFPFTRYGHLGFGCYLF